MLAVVCKHQWEEIIFSEDNRCLAYMCRICGFCTSTPKPESPVFYIEEGMYVADVVKKA